MFYSNMESLLPTMLNTDAQKYINKQAMTKVEYYVQKNYPNVTHFGCCIISGYPYTGTERCCEWLIEAYFCKNDERVRIYCEVTYKLQEGVPEWYIDGYTHKAQDSVFLRESKIERYEV